VQSSRSVTDRQGFDEPCQPCRSVVKSVAYASSAQLLRHVTTRKQARPVGQNISKFRQVVSRATGPTDLTGQMDVIFSESCSRYRSVDSCNPTSLFLLQLLYSDSTLSALTLSHPALLPSPNTKEEQWYWGLLCYIYAFGTEIAFVEQLQRVGELSVRTKVSMRKIYLYVLSSRGWQVKASGRIGPQIPPSRKMSTRTLLRTNMREFELCLLADYSEDENVRVWDSENACERELVIEVHLPHHW
jgi:hypothetical protein